MELELVLRKNNKTGTLYFYIPKIFLKPEYNHAFVEPKLIEGNKYRIIIEEIN